MSPELKQIWRVCLKYTLWICLAELAAAVLLCPDMASRLSWAGGILVGGAAGLAGLYMICMQAARLSPDAEKMQHQGVFSYAVRYLFYALCLFAGVFAGLPIVGLLGGMLASKASLLLFSLTGRKERQ